MIRTPVIVAFFALLHALPALAEHFEGRVTGVISGDTLVVTQKVGKKQKQRHRVMLIAINAPLQGQPFFYSSQQNLQKLAYKKQVKVEWDKYDARCGATRAPKSECRKIGRVVLEDGTDLSLVQAKLGMAWVNPDRLDELSTPDRTTYGEAMGTARRRRIGLWQSRNPLPPWDFWKKN